MKNYVNNSSLLEEIDKSKLSFCSTPNKNYYKYHIIVTEIDTLNSYEKDAYKKWLQDKKFYEQETLNEKEFKRVKKTIGMFEKLILVDDIEKLDDNIINMLKAKKELLVPNEDFIIRCQTISHIDKLNRQKLKFLPFKHFLFENGKLKEVLRSQWKGDFTTGKFEQEHGKITNNLATMIMLLVERYALKGNWRGYTYIEDMKCEALAHLCKVSLQFDEARWNNPFAYYTTCITHTFKSELNLEKKNRDLRDTIIEMSGLTGSFSSQTRDEEYNNDSKEFYKYQNNYESVNTHSNNVVETEE